MPRSPMHYNLLGAAQRRDGNAHLLQVIPTAAFAARAASEPGHITIPFNSDRTWLSFAMSPTELRSRRSRLPNWCVPAARVAPQGRRTSGTRSAGALHSLRSHARARSGSPASLAAVNRPTSTAASL